MKITDIVAKLSLKCKKQEQVQQISFSEREVWFVTGCSSGIGKELCQELLKRGFKVAAGLRNCSRLTDLKEKYPENLLLLELDVTNKKQVNAAVKKAFEYFGKINVLVNNAGISHFCAIEECDEEEAKSILDVNLWGTVRMTMAVLPLMRQQRQGLIINMSSVCGFEAFAGVTYYCVSKFAMEGFSQALRKEVKSLGIDVVVINPSAVRTAISAKVNFKIPKIKEYREILKESIYVFENEIECKYSKISPVKTAAAIIDISMNKNNSLNIILGTDCVNIVRNRLNDCARDLEHCKDIAKSVEYEEGL